MGGYGMGKEDPPKQIFFFLPLILRKTSNIAHKTMGSGFSLCTQFSFSFSFSLGS